MIAWLKRWKDKEVHHIFFNNDFNNDSKVLYSTFTQ